MRIYLELWTAFFRLEIEYIEKLLQRQSVLGLSDATVKRKAEEADDQVSEIVRKQAVLMEGILPRVVFDNAVSTKVLKNDLQLRCDFLKMIPASSLAVRAHFRPLRAHILSSISRDFTDSSQAYAVRAEELLTDSVLDASLHYAAEAAASRKKSKTHDFDDDPVPVASKFSSSVLEMEGPSIALLEQGVQTLNTADMHEVYVNYLDSRLDYWVSRVPAATTEGEEEEEVEVRAQAVEAVDFIASKLLAVCEQAVSSEVGMNVNVIKTWTAIALRCGDTMQAVTSLQQLLDSNVHPGELSMLLVEIRSRQLLLTSDEKQFKQACATITTSLRSALATLEKNTEG